MVFDIFFIASPIKAIFYILLLTNTSVIVWTNHRRGERAIRLTAYTNYSLRILMYCALHPAELVRIQDIAASFGISKAHLLKSATHLGQLGYLTTVRGRSGGVTLALAPERISLGAVVREVEGTCEFVECFNSKTNTCPIAGVCKLTALFHKAIEAFYQELDDVTLADLVLEGDPLRDRLTVLNLA